MQQCLFLAVAISSISVVSLNSPLKKGTGPLQPHENSTTKEGLERSSPLFQRAVNAVASTAQKDGVPTVEAIQKHLRQLFPVKDPHVAGRLQFRPGAQLIEFSTPALRRADPTLRLYRTSFSTGQFEYPVVEVALAVWMEGGELKIEECLSPTYTAESASFVDRLRGLKGKTVAEREKLGNEICAVFSGITHGGRIVGGQLTDNEYRAELWHNRMKWRTVQIAFDQKGAITLVRLIR